MKILTLLLSFGLLLNVIQDYENQEACYSIKPYVHETVLKEYQGEKVPQGYKVILQETRFKTKLYFYRVFKSGRRHRIKIITL